MSASEERRQALLNLAHRELDGLIHSDEGQGRDPAEMQRITSAIQLFEAAARLRPRERPLWPIVLFGAVLVVAGLSVFLRTSSTALVEIQAREVTFLARSNGEYFRAQSAAAMTLGGLQSVTGPRHQQKCGRLEVGSAAEASVHLVGLPVQEGTRIGVLRMNSRQVGLRAAGLASSEVSIHVKPAMPVRCDDRPLDLASFAEPHTDPIPLRLEAGNAAGPQQPPDYRIAIDVALRSLEDELLLSDLPVADVRFGRVDYSLDKDWPTLGDQSSVLGGRVRILETRKDYELSPGEYLELRGSSGQLRQLAWSADCSAGGGRQKLGECLELYFIGTAKDIRALSRELPASLSPSLFEKYRAHHSVELLFIGFNGALALALGALRLFGQS